jgi:hypothetical protein
MVKRVESGMNSSKKKKIIKTGGLKHKDYLNKEKGILDLRNH